MGEPRYTLRRKHTYILYCVSSNALLFIIVSLDKYCILHIAYTIYRITGEDSYLHRMRGVGGRRNPEKGHHLYSLARIENCSGRRTEESENEPHHFYETNIRKFTNTDVFRAFLYTGYALLSCCTNNIHIVHVPLLATDEISCWYVSVASHRVAFKFILLSSSNVWKLTCWYYYYYHCRCHHYLYRSHDFF